MTALLSFLVVASIAAMAAAFHACGVLERSVDALEKRLEAREKIDSQKTGDKP